MSLGVGIVNTGSWAKRLWPGVHTWYGDQYAQYEKEYEEIFDMVKSDKLYEEFVSMAGTGLGVTKNEGQAITYSSFRQGLTTRLVNVVYGLGFIITHEVMADDQYATKLVEQGSRFLAKSMLQLKEQLGANVLNNGFSTDATHIGGDGLSLFNTAHTTISGVTYQNRPTADMDLSEAALEQSYIDIAAQVDEAGLKIKVIPRKLIIPRQLQFTAERILKTPLRTSTADNDINAIKAMGVLPEGYRVNHYLTGSKAWFIKTDCPNGLVMLEREGYESGADNDFDTGNAKFKVTERYFQSFVDPRGAYGSSPA
jgi:hypothetical protein